MMPELPRPKFPEIDMKLKDECRNTVYTASILTMRIDIEVLTLLVLTLLERDEDKGHEEAIALLNELMERRTNEMKAWLSPYCEVELKPPAASAPDTPQQA